MAIPNPYQVDVYVAGYPCVSLSSLNVCPEPFERAEAKTGSGYHAAMDYVDKYQPQAVALEMFVKWFSAESRMTMLDHWTSRTNAWGNTTFVQLSLQIHVSMASHSLETGCGCCTFAKTKLIVDQKPSKET